MKGFIVNPSYIIEDKKAIITLHGRLENGESFLAKIPDRPYFYIKKSDLKKAKKLVNLESETSDMKNMKGEDVVKILVNIPMEVKQLRELLYEKEIGSYEADTRFAYRYLMNKGIKGSIDIEGSFEKGEKVDRIYINPEIKPSDYSPKNLKILSFDIEAHHKSWDLYCLSIYTEDFTEAYFVGKAKNAISCETEKEALEKFKEKVEELDPDVIIGWNVIDFDLDYLKKRFEIQKIPFNFGRSNQTIRLNIQSQFFRDSSATIPGRIALDGIHLLKGSFIKLPDYRLDTAAEHFLGERKLITSTKVAKYEEINSMYKKNPEKLVEYNIKDSVLAYDILKKSGTFELTVQRSILTGMAMDRVNASIASLDQVYIPEMNKQKIVANVTSFSRKDYGLAGGFVMDSKPGIYDYVLVLDFKSLYATVIKTFNIDPVSFLGMDSKENKKTVIKSPNGAIFRNDEGILPKIISNLLEEREIMKTAGNKPASAAIKLLMNSFWGSLASPMCRFFNFDMASAITSFARFIIKKTAEEIRNNGYEVIYGDTDSVFVNVIAKTEKEAKNIGKQIAKSMNQFFLEYINKEYNRDNSLELEFEKCFIRFWMPKVRGKEEGSKKRYAGLINKNGKETIDFTGLEFVRRDWTDIAKKFQRELLMKVFKKQPVEQFVNDFVNEIKAGKRNKLLVYRKAIRKNLESYTKTTPPHVKAARKLKNGIADLQDNIVEYYLTTDGPEPIQNLKHKIDYDHYIEKQIKPLADAILDFFDKSFEEIIQGSKQTTLGGF